MKHILFPLFFIITLNVSAQFKIESIFLTGKIITNKDTINCFIKQSINYNSKTINYKKNKEDDEILKIESSIINHLSIGRYRYDRITTEKHSYLMKNLKKGTISLYKHQLSVYRHPAPNFNSPHITQGYSKEKEKEKLYVVDKVETIELKRKKYKHDLIHLMSDKPDLHVKINKLKFKDVLFEFNLIELISKYNYWFKELEIK